MSIVTEYIRNLVAKQVDDNAHDLEAICEVGTGGNHAG
jgi:hypothetical protein